MKLTAERGRSHNFSHPSNLIKRIECCESSSGLFIARLEIHSYRSSGGCTLLLPIKDSWTPCTDTQMQEGIISLWKTFVEAHGLSPPLNHGPSLSLSLSLHNLEWTLYLIQISG
ncbi:hypothetical protein AMTRI_Chr01g135140 [Amborella trichopoda]